MNESLRASAPLAHASRVSLARNKEPIDPGRISLVVTRIYWRYVTAVMHRVAHAVIACASRDSLDRAYRFISRFFIAPATRLTRLVYDSDADAASR